VSRVLVAPQELKGSLTAGEATRALELGLRRARPEWRLDLLPLADGGPGTLDLVQSQRPTSRVHLESVADPLGRPVQARWLQLDATTALVEMAEAAGLWRLGTARHPLDVDTRGVGQLIAAAREAGCTYIIVGAGGSATSDAGAGAASALGVRFFDDNNRELEPRPRALTRCTRVERVGRVVPRLEVWTDVRNPLEDAARVYAPQKGATEEDVALIARAHATLEALAPRDAGRVPGAGAAGGLAFGLHAFLEATIEPG
jgi:glycerate kinase